MNYKNYLASSHWKETKERFKSSKFKKRCSICRTTVGLELHHKTYKRIGQERLSDLVYLCRSCHESVHQYLKLFKNRKLNLWNAIRKLRSRLHMRRRNFRSLPRKLHEPEAKKRIGKFLKKVTNWQTQTP